MAEVPTEEVVALIPFGVELRRGRTGGRAIHPSATILTVDFHGILIATAGALPTAGNHHIGGTAIDEARAGIERTDQPPLPIGAVPLQRPVPPISVVGLGDAIAAGGTGQGALGAPAAPLASRRGGGVVFVAAASQGSDRRPEDGPRSVLAGVAHLGGVRTDLGHDGAEVVPARVRAEGLPIGQHLVLVGHILIGFAGLCLSKFMCCFLQWKKIRTRACSSRTTKLYYTTSKAQSTCRCGVTKQQAGGGGGEDRPVQPVQNNEPISSLLSSFGS